MMACQQCLAALAATLERDPRFVGKRVADIPRFADFRRKWRWRWYRVADANMFVAIFNLVLALSPSSLWFVNAGCVGLCTVMVFWAEGRAQTISRQLNRPVSLQIARDALGMPFDA